MSLIEGQSRKAFQQLSNVRTFSPLLELENFSPKMCFLDVQHMIYEGFFTKTVRNLFPHENEKGSGKLFSKQSLVQITQRLRVYPFMHGQHPLTSLETTGWTSSQFMNLLEALPFLLHNMLPAFECQCDVMHISEDVSKYYDRKSTTHLFLDHYIHIIEVRQNFCIYSSYAESMNCLHNLLIDRK